MTKDDKIVTMTLTIRANCGGEWEDGTPCGACAHCIDTAPRGAKMLGALISSASYEAKSRNIAEAFSKKHPTIMMSYHQWLDLIEMIERADSDLDL